MLPARLLPVTATWQEVATQLRPFVARRISPSEIDDVMQEVFVRMHRGLPMLRDEERFTSWLFQIARNAIADHLRARARHPVADEPVHELAAPPLDDDATTAALARCVAMFVAQLASPYREAITLVELEGQTAKAAAELAGISVSGMKSRVQRGRAQLRALFDACCEIALDVRGKPIAYAARPQQACKCR